MFNAELEITHEMLTSFVERTLQHRGFAPQTVRLRHQLALLQALGLFEAGLGPQLRGGRMSPTLRTLVIASGNLGKIREFESLLGGLPLRITAQPDGLEVEETGQTSPPMPA